MFDIITFGSAIQDTFLKLDEKSYKILKSNKFSSEKAICFSLGSKIFINDSIISSGGGGTNTAYGFTKQGFKVAYIGKVGNDKNGDEIIEELKNLNIDISFVKKDNNHSTAFSVILSSLSNERTILIHKGASHFLQKKDIPWNKLKAKCFYLAPLSGVSSKLFNDIVEFAFRNKAMIAVNPGNSQLEIGAKLLKPILSKIDILMLNQEEASLLTKIPFQKEKEIFKKLDKLIPGIAVMTKGKNGVVVSDGEYIWEANSLDVSVVEKTGAGDAFCSGFVSAFIKTKNISDSIKLGIANSASCIQKVGAKEGLLKKRDKALILKIKLTKNKLF